MRTARYLVVLSAIVAGALYIQPIPGLPTWLKVSAGVIAAMAHAVKANLTRRPQDEPTDALIPGEVILQGRVATGVSEVVEPGLPAGVVPDKPWPRPEPPTQRTP